MADLGVMELCSGFLASSFSPLMDRRMAYPSQISVSASPALDDLDNRKSISVQ